MKKFLANVFLFFLLVSAATACLNYVYMKLDKSDPDNTKKFETIPSSIRVCNFGSSHGLCGFNYEDAEGMNCFNFALSSQTLSYDKRLYDNYKEDIAKGAVVFIPVSYFSFFGNDECINGGFAEKNKRYYRILPSGLIKEYDFKTDIYVNTLPSLIAGDKFIKVMLGRSEDTFDEGWSGAASADWVRNDAEVAYKRHIAYRLDEKGNRIWNREEIDALDYMVKDCQKRGYTPVLVTVPLMKEYTDTVRKNDPHLYDDFYGVIHEIVSRTNVLYCDYAFDERFINNYEWFMNADHLNKEGARQFVNILMDEVVHYGQEDSLLQ